MPRLPVALTEEKYIYLSMLAKKNNDSMSNIVNELIDLGMEELITKNKTSSTLVEQYCQQQIIQMNILMKNLTEQVLKLDQKYFDDLREKVLVKFHKLLSNESNL